MIQKITIENFKCFDKKTIYTKPLTVLSGINAVGKSSVLQAVILSIQSVKKITKFTEGSYEQNLSLNDDNSVHLGNVTDILNYNLDLTNFKLTLDLSKDSIYEITSNIDKIKNNVNVDVLINTSGGDLEEQLNGLANSQYISAERLGPLVIHEENDISNDVGIYGQNSVSILNQKSIEVVDNLKCFSEHSIRLLLKAVEEWIDFIVPGTELRTEKIGDVEKIKLQIRNSKDSKFIKPSNTGFGISYVLPIIVAAMIAPKGSSLIIENPEAHLHPLGQSRIGEFLSVIANSGVQLIVETHSDHIINGIRLAIINGKIDHENVLINFFSKDEIQVHVNPLEINSIGEINDWPEGFLDQERVDLKNLLFKRMKR